MCRDTHAGIRVWMRDVYRDMEMRVQGHVCVDMGDACAGTRVDGRDACAGMRVDMKDTHVQGHMNTGTRVCGHRRVCRDKDVETQRDTGTRVCSDMYVWTVTCVCKDMGTRVQGCVWT